MTYFAQRLNRTQEKKRKHIEPKGYRCEGGGGDLRETVSKSGIWGGGRINLKKGRKYTTTYEKKVRN